MIKIIGWGDWPSRETMSSCWSNLLAASGSSNDVFNQHLNEYGAYIDWRKDEGRDVGYFIFEDEHSATAFLLRWS